MLKNLDRILTICLLIVIGISRTSAMQENERHIEDTRNKTHNFGATQFEPCFIFTDTSGNEIFFNIADVWGKNIS